jgi:diadenosine tetraphosphate (Ap4A) HIT family hydrolase
MSYDSNNIFARILRQEIPCDRVYEDDKVLAFKDIRPKAPIHLLVIPKGAYRNFHDFNGNAPAEWVAHFYKTVSDLAKDHSLDETGYRIVANCGAHAGEEVPHFHVHILGGGPLGSMVCSHPKNPT